MMLSCICATCGMLESMLLAAGAVQCTFSANIRDAGLSKALVEAARREQKRSSGFFFSMMLSLLSLTSVNRYSRSVLSTP